MSTTALVTLAMEAYNMAVRTLGLRKPANTETEWDFEFIAVFISF